MNNMKVYFAHSIYVIPSQLECFRSYFTRNKINFTTRELPADPFNVNFDEAEKLYNFNMKQIKSCDLMVVECSYASNGLGYEISIALHEKKPVIVLYNMDIDKDNPRHIKNIPLELKGNRSRHLLLKEYTPHNINKVLDFAINEAMQLLGSKFNFILPADLDRYLEWVSKEDGESKSNILRNLTHDSMSQNTKYHDFLDSSKSE